MSIKKGKIPLRAVLPVFTVFYKTREEMFLSKINRKKQKQAVFGLYGTFGFTPFSLFLHRFREEKKYAFFVNMTKISHLFLRRVLFFEIGVETTFDVGVEELTALVRRTTERFFKTRRGGEREKTPIFQTVANVRENGVKSIGFFFGEKAFAVRRIGDDTAVRVGGAEVLDVLDLEMDMVFHPGAERVTGGERDGFRVDVKAVKTQFFIGCFTVERLFERRFVGVSVEEIPLDEIERTQFPRRDVERAESPFDDDGAAAAKRIAKRVFRRKIAVRKESGSERFP